MVKQEIHDPALYLACTDEADNDGQFQMPAGMLSNLVGVGRRHAQRAMAALIDAGLIRIVHEGGRRQANVYGLVPWREFDRDHALKAFEKQRRSNAERIEREIIDDTDIGDTDGSE